jgi:poly(A) polymerase
LIKLLKFSFLNRSILAENASEFNPEMLKSAIKIVEKLTAAGFIAYFAGGAVRDRLLDRKISDIDIATSATPEDVEKLFQKTHPIGKDFGVMLVILGKHAFEVASFRGESDYDGRRPGKVFFTDAKADAQRRDFTVNGLFLNPLNNEVLDYVGGQHDLKLKVIRFIGNSEERVMEDHLRILRGVRFRNLLNFEYEPKTAEAIDKHASLIEKISGERIRDELNKMFENENRAFAVRDLERFGLLEILIPELMELRGLPQPTEFHKEGDTYTHSLGSFAALPKKVSLAVAWATLLHDIGKAKTMRKDPDRIRYPGHAEASAKIADKILKRLRMDNATRAKIIWLVDNHMLFGDLEKMRLAHRHSYFTHPWFAELLQVCLADVRGTSPGDYSLYRKVAQMWKNETQALLLPAPKDLLNGDEIVSELHIAKGKQIGRLKKILHDAQVEGLVKSREEAIRFLEKCLQR